MIHNRDFPNSAKRDGISWRESVHLGHKGKLISPVNITLQFDYNVEGLSRYVAELIYSVIVQALREISPDTLVGFLDIQSLQINQSLADCTLSMVVVTKDIPTIEEETFQYLTGARFDQSTSLDGTTTIPGFYVVWISFPSSFREIRVTTIGPNNFSEEEVITRPQPSYRYNP
jgi:hypothetical protein